LTTAPVLELIVSTPSIWLASMMVPNGLVPAMPIVRA
jgi:hypothetical protein